jgi:hypothetical protein
MDLAYWKRLWILQEIVFAKSPESHWLFHDRELLTYASFDLLTTLLLAMAEITPPPFMDAGLWFGIMTTLSKNTDLILISDMKRFHKWPFLLHSCKIIFTIRASLRCACRDPRDVFYALLGVIPIQMEPYYRKSVRQVSLEWAKDVLLGSPETGVLFLQYSGIGQRQESEYDLPSWLPDVHHIRNGA